MAVNDDVRQLNIRQVGVNNGVVRIKKSGNGKISILNQHGDVILGADDENNSNFLDLVCSKDMVLDLYGEQIGDANLILEYKYRNFTYTDKLAVKVVQCDIVFRLGSEALGLLYSGEIIHMVDLIMEMIEFMILVILVSRIEIFNILQSCCQ